MVTSMHDETTPESIGRYRVLRRLGRGGMGVVYLAEDPDLHRHVAVKVLAPELAARADFIARFKREAEAVSKLEHPGIVAIYELGQADERPFLVMRYVEGLPLREWIRSLHDGDEPPTVATTTATKSTIGTSTAPTRPLDPPPAFPATGSVDSTPNLGRDHVGEVLRVVEAIADALDFAHRHGVIHRDVKPSNVIVDPEGRPHLLDFGLARMTDGDDTVTQPGKLVGSLPFMAPEQVATTKVDVDHRADIYALGVTLYECLCGVRPFAAPTGEQLMFQIVMKDPTSPREHNPVLSRDVATVTLKCLEKNPSRRYSTCADFARELKRLRGFRQIEARPIGTWGRLVRQAERRPLVSVLTIIGLLAAVIVPTAILAIRHAQRQEDRRLAVYRKYIARADKLEARRAELARQLDDARDELPLLMARIPRHAAHDSDDKEELFDHHREIARLETDVARLTGEIEYCLLRSRETEEKATPDERRSDLYVDLYLQAEAQSDAAKLELYRRLLEGTDLLAALEGPGRLTLVTDPPKARVVAHRYEDDGAGRLRLDEGSRRELGVTPLRDVSLPTGSYLLEIEKDGFRSTRYPLLVERGQHWGSPTWHDGRFADRNWTVRLLSKDSLGPEWRYVPAGPFRRSKSFSPYVDAERRWEFEDAFLVARHEVTFGDYVEFLRSPAAGAEVLRNYQDHQKIVLIPRRFESSEPYITQWDKGLPKPPPDLDMSGTLVGVSHKDADAFIAWMSQEIGATVDLPTSSQWEKSARGVDGRLYPWGNGFDWSFTSGRYSEASREWRYKPRPPGRFPVDVSPYGVVDLAGNASEWCRDKPDWDDFNDLYIYCGGAHGFNDPRGFFAWPLNAVPWEHVSDALGLRLVRAMP